MTSPLNLPVTVMFLYIFKDIQVKTSNYYEPPSSSQHFFNCRYWL
jgi:hypothetical protein